MSGRSLRWFLLGVAVLLLLVVGALALFPLLLDTPTVQAYVAQTASHAVGRPVKFSSLAVSLLPLPHVDLKGLEIADDPRFGTAPLLRVGQMRVGLRVRPLLSLRIELASITLQDAQVEAIEDGGRWNFAALGGATPSSRPSPRPVPGVPGGAAMGSVVVSRISLKNAAVNIRRHSVKNGNIRIEALDAVVSGVGGSELDVRGDAKLEPGDLKLRNIQATVGLRGSGELPIKASVDLEGSDIGPLARRLVMPSPALAGPIKGKLQLSGTPARLSGGGQVDLSRLTLTDDKPQCRPARRQLVLDEVHVPIVLKPASLESFPLAAKVGKGAVGFNLTAGLSDSLLTLADIRIAGLSLQPILQDYLCQSFAVAGPLDLTGQLSMRTTDVLRTMNGTGQFKVGAGRVIGEGALKVVRDVLSAGNVLDMALRGKLADPGRHALDFDSITGSFKIVNGVARTDDVVYQSRELRVTVAGTYALADERTDMKVVATQGSNTLRAQVTGTGTALRVVPTGVNVKEPAEVRKFLDRLLR